MSTTKLKAKIAGLRAKTTAAGCTEAEAMAAAEIVARLMREHGLSEADLVMTDASAQERTVRATWRARLAAVIAEVTNTAVMYRQHGPRTSEVLFAGRAPGPEIAVYLREVCIRAVEASLKAFKEGEFYRRRRTVRTKRQAAADFVHGLIVRLHHRLLDLFAASVDQGARDEAMRALAVRFPNAVTFGGAPRETRFNEALSRGFVAGGQIELSHGVRTEAPRQIALF